MTKRIEAAAVQAVIGTLYPPPFDEPWHLEMPVADIIPLVLTAILASIPVALPATFTLASALGARALAKLGVLPTRLSAVDEAASMVVLCADKTGTLTQMR
jgi:H+-transporting ATPase